MTATIPEIPRPVASNRRSPGGFGTRFVGEGTVEGLVLNVLEMSGMELLLFFFKNMLDRFFWVGIMYMLLVGLWLGDSFVWRNVDLKTDFRRKEHC